MPAPPHQKLLERISSRHFDAADRNDFGEAAPRGEAKSLPVRGQWSSSSSTSRTGFHFLEVNTRLRVNPHETVTGT